MFSVLSADLFNEVSHFMGTNGVVQFVLQPYLIIWSFIPFRDGNLSRYKNVCARPVKYAMDKPSENSNWMSRNMVITGLMIMLFLGLHFYDFWIPEIKDKFIDGIWDESYKILPSFA